MKYIRLLGWEKYQHYKNRSPLWIKLYRDLLTSRMWLGGDDASRVLAVSCMLLASEHQNAIPLDVAYLKRRAYLNGEINLQPLIDLDFLEIVDEAELALDLASNLLAQRREEKSREEKRINTSAVEVASNLLAAEPEKPAELDTEKLVRTIAETHPANWRAKGSMIIPPAHCEAIIRALGRDGERVREGTIAYAKAVENWPPEERRMVVNPVKFYNESHYLKDPQLWERQTDGQASKQRDRIKRNRETIIDALRENHREAVGSGSTNTRKRAG